MSKTILAFGELLWDILPQATVLGGAPFNFAYRVHALGNRAWMISRLGRDRLGQLALQKAIELGLDTTLLQWDEHHSTGTVQVHFDLQQNPDYVINPNVAYDYIEWNPSLEQAAAQADCLCFGSLVQRTTITRETLAQLLHAAPQALKFLDINLRKDCYDESSIDFSLQQAHILKLNEDEAYQLARMLGLGWKSLPDFCAAMLKNRSLKFVLVTLGEKGAFAMAKDGNAYYTPGYQVPLADPCGAGDAFSAGFLHQLLQQANLADACEFGNLMGAMVATQQGATVPIAKANMEAFQKNNHQRTIEPSLASYR
jgi:fructokinase